MTRNAVIVAGHVPTQQDRTGAKLYGGGVENCFRYMENWGGRTHGFEGSILLMFQQRPCDGVLVQAEVQSAPPGVVLESGTRHKNSARGTGEL